MYTFTIRITLALSLASVAHGQAKCGNIDGDGGGAFDNDLCTAALAGHSLVGASEYKTGEADTDCADANECDLSNLADFNSCCTTPACDEYVCQAGAQLIADPADTDQDGNAATCCVAKTATACNSEEEFFCAARAGIDSADDPCLGGDDASTACDDCTTHKIEPNGGAYTGAGETPGTCEENICDGYDQQEWASLGIMFGGDGTDVDDQDVKISDLVGKTITAAPGWDFPAGLQATAEGVANLPAACTGSVDGVDCAFDGDGACPDGCLLTRAASITCASEDGSAPFVVAGAEGYECTMPTEAEEGTVIADMACASTTTGAIECSQLYTCDSTHHLGSDDAGNAIQITVNGPDGLAGNDDDGVKCLEADGVLQVQVSDGETEIANGCNINRCKAPEAAGAVVPDGYVPDTSSGTTVDGLGDVTCFKTADPDDATAESDNWWGTATCTGTVAASHELSDGTADCSTWGPWADYGHQEEHCPVDHGCVYDNTLATVTCAQAPGEAADLNQFQYDGCSQAKCTDITGDDGEASEPFGDSEPNVCSTGMTLLTGDELQKPCAGSECTTWDCCSDDDGCAEIADPGFDQESGTLDDGKHPCYGTNSACIDVPAPGVGNRCECCDGDTLPSIRDLAQDDGGCGGSIGFFGDTVQSAQDADANPVQGSCFACTPIANSAEDPDTWANPAQSGDADVNEPDKMVTCEEAENSRAVACITGAIHVNNADNGVSDVCRLECPFTEVVALIDRLHIHTDRCHAVDLTDGSPDEATQTAECQAVPGCYYTPCADDDGDGVCNDDSVATCRPIYAGCNGIESATEDTCTGSAAPKLAGSSGTVGDGDATAACTWNADDSTCTYMAASAEDYQNTIQRCDALLGTGWAHDLRDSCDATRACPLHGAIDDAVPGMLEMVKAVYTDAGAPPAGTDTWEPGAAPAAAGGDGLTSLALTSEPARPYFLNDGNDASYTDWEVCLNIRDAVLAAPTCSAGSGR